MDNLNIMQAFLMLGDNDNEESLSDKVKYKERIVFSTMRSLIPDWEKPKDWNNLSDQIKMERLKKLETV